MIPIDMCIQYTCAIYCQHILRISLYSFNSTFYKNILFSVGFLNQLQSSIHYYPYHPLNHN